MAGELLERLLALATGMMRIPSTEHRPADRARCFDYCRALLGTVHGVEIREYEQGGFVSMVAGARGVEVPGVLLVGHLDVVEHPDEDLFRAEVRDGRLWGPGAGDMKGQCAIMLELFRDIHARFPGIPLGIALTSDEERGGADGVRFLFEEVGLRCGLAIVPDGGSIDRVTIEEKGILQVRLRVVGHEGHAAAPWLGRNALAILVRCLGRLDAYFEKRKVEESADHWYATCVPTICETRNHTVNRMPGEAEAVVDIRFPPPDSVEGLLEVVRSLAGEEVVVEVVGAARATRLSPDPLYFQVAEEMTGGPVRGVRASGGSDALFIEQYGIPVVLSSPVVGNLHRVDEWMDLASMELFHAICEKFIRAKLGAG